MDAGAADYLLVSALDEAAQFCIAVVHLNTPGLTIQSQRLMDGRQYGSVSLENVEVEEWLEGDAVEQGFTRALDEATIMLCCEMLGASRELLNAPWPTCRNASSSTSKSGRSKHSSIA